MPGGARGISSNRFSSSPWYISKFLVFIGFLLVPLGSLLFLRIPSGFLGFLVVSQGSLEFFKVPQSSQNSFGFFGVHMVSTSSLGFLMVLYCSLGFSRNPQGTLSFLEFQGFIGYLRICQGLLWFFRIPLISQGSLEFRASWTEWYSVLLLRVARTIIPTKYFFQQKMILTIFLFISF